MFPDIATISLAIYSVFTTIAFVLIRRKNSSKEKKEPFKGYRALIECIDELDIDPIRKVALRERYVERSAELRVDAIKAKETQSKIDTYNIALSATITVLTAAEAAIENVVPFISVGLLVAILSSFNTFLLSYSAQNGLKEKWLDNKQSSELLESEIWMYLTRADEYVFSSHSDSAALAILNNERVILTAVEKQIMASRQRNQQNRMGNDVEDGSILVDTPEGMSSTVTVRTTDNGTDVQKTEDDRKQRDKDIYGGLESRIHPTDPKFSMGVSSNRPVPPAIPNVQFSPTDEPNEKLFGEDDDDIEYTKRGRAVANDPRSGEPDMT